jgi:hypothetical protein
MDAGTHTIPNLINQSMHPKRLSERKRESAGGRDREKRKKKEEIKKDRVRERKVEKDGREIGKTRLARQP